MIRRTGNVQVYDQSIAEPATSGSAADDSGLWSWSHCDESNLFEVSEFRAHMPLHNFYEGYSTAKDGSVAPATLDAAEERLRTVLEQCDRLRCIETLVDMDSSWGGFAHELLTYVADECPRAVVATFGTDWAYPLADQSAASVFALTPDSRDRAKADARRRLNISSSLSVLADVSTLLVPLAMASSSLPRTRFGHLRVDRARCRDVSTLAATAIELALSAHRALSAYDIVDGVMPSRKVLALAAAFPFDRDPVELLTNIERASEQPTAHEASESDVIMDQCSLLPAVAERTSTARGEDDGDSDSDDERAHSRHTKVFARRVHLRGSFGATLESPTSLARAIERVRSAQCVVQWTPRALELPASYSLARDSLAGAAVDAVAQLAATTDVGRYLHDVKQRVQRVDKRVLFEFTRAGMNPDALEDLDESLGALRDAYLQ